MHDASALNETRTLTFHHTHSDEDLTVTFKRDGRYDEDALKRLNHLLRDWRTQDEIAMDRHLFDIIWEVYRDVDGKEPIQVVSAYRSPATNAMLRRRSSGVARFSQHMLGHAMDFYIPSVPLEQIRLAGLRLQRGGVGFYPTSGSPFVHLDTGNIRHWPRMTHDQLVKVFPDGRTVHIPSDGVPLRGYELARAEIERRGNREAITGGRSFLAALFGMKSSDEDEEIADDKPAPPVVPATAKPADRKTAAAIPTPRAKPHIAAALRLASADAESAQAPKQQTQTANDKASNDTSGAILHTPADIINARGFWGDDPSTPKQAASAQLVAAITARQALESTDAQTAPSVLEASQALAYASQPAPKVDQANVVAASAPIPHSARLSLASRNAATAAIGVDMVAAKGAQGENTPIANATRIASAGVDGAGLRIIILAPSFGESMSVTVLGNTDLTRMREFFVKPQASIIMNFSDDPMTGMTCDRFSGSVTSRLDTTSFTLQTAALR